MGCEDELVVEIHPASGRFSPGQYTVIADVGSFVASCTVTSTVEGLGLAECTPAGAQLFGSLRCEGAGCRPENMQTREVMQLSVRGNPPRAVVRVERDGALLRESTLAPTYELCGCAPNGRFGSVSVTVD